MSLANMQFMECAQLVDTLHAQGVILLAENGELRVFGAQEVLADEGLVAAIRAQKPQIIAHLSQNETACTGLKVDHAARHEPFPLTDIQRAYWVGRQDAFDHGSVSIHFYTETDIKGLDVARLTAAWNATVARHDMLRAVVDEDAMQRILPDVPDYEIAVTDLSGLPEEEREARLAEHRHTASHTVHRADEWPGFGLSVFALGDDRFRLSYSQDLLHVDGGSLLRVIGDFCAAYTTPGAALAPITLSFRDYVFHEIAQKETPAYQGALAYWRDVVKDLPPPPTLPLRPRTQDDSPKTGRFRRLAFDMPPAAYATIKAQSHAMGITPTGWVMAAFAEIVSRWSGSADCTLNVTVFNRPNLSDDLLRIAGDFTSMIPVPLRRADGATLGARAQRMQHCLWQHVKHREVSGITILDLLRTARGDQRAAALSVVYTSLLNLSGQGFDPKGFGALGTPDFTLTQTPQVTLDHQVSETPEGGIGFSWDVVEGHYPDGMIEDMFEAFRLLVCDLVAQDSAWQRLDAERADYLPHRQGAVLAALNGFDPKAPQPKVTLRDMLDAAMAAHPDALALATPEEVLTHAQLHRAARRLAAQLVAAGVCHADRVGILMHKGFAQPVAAMAVHLAGAAYVPIDPTVPEARFAHIAHDADLHLCLTDPAMADTFAAHPLPRLVVDAALLDDTEGAADFTPAPLDPQDLSHVIYTSGSTGMPKGVMITHANVVNRMQDIIARFDIRSTDRALGLTALHHDLSVFDIFGVLAAGAGLVLPAHDTRLDPEAWLVLMNCHGVTLWNSVPAFAGILADYIAAKPAAGADRLPPLRWMILAGDWIPVALPNALRAIWPDLDLIASGGPTETTIWDIWNRVGAVDPRATSIPYGKPLTQAGYHVLDSCGRRCPLWVPGELHITGTGVTKGYLNRPEETAARYLALPGFDGTVYRSGDLGRVLPDGNIEFLGRNDFQVKINGLRIELGEIERTAQEVDGVRDCVTVVRDGPQGKALAAFITSDEAPGGQPSELPCHDRDTDAEETAFRDRKIVRSDPAARLEAKLAYRPLTPRDPASARLHPLGTPVPHDSRLKSWRQYDDHPLTLEALNRFLSPLHGARPAPGTEGKFAYGSGGGLYPVQVYLYLRASLGKDMPAGIWRYYPFDHALELVSAGPLPGDIHWGYNRAWADTAPIHVYLVADLEEISAQYGDLARPLSLIEAGSIAQLLRHAADETGFGTCAVGDISFPRTAARFGLGPHQELMLALVAGELAQNEETPPPARSTPLTERVREALAQALPSHMVPQSITRLDAIPLTGNGKVDRKALIAMDTGPDHGAPHEVTAPQGDFETAVAGILANLLERPKISVTDNFFDIGASSALLVKAYHRIKSETEQEFPLIALFRFPSVRRLSEHLGSGAVSTPSTAPVSAREQERAGRQAQAIARLSSLRKKV